jgi:UDP-GlcNAc:undecaprenyl-phosphate/decaprenyl-phosphate GlcNAc-1-phosphate transferase
VISLAAAAALVPAAIRVSRRTGFLDRPEGWKSHAGPIPLLGGVAVVLAFCAGVWVGSDNIARVAPILLGMLGLAALGTVDDWTPLKARHKLPAEIAAATLLWTTGLGWHVGPDPVSFAVTVVWVVAVINAINLFDLLDGQAATIAIVIAAGCATLAMIGGDVVVTGASVALAGACLGFLPFNVASPARIFLGDAGTIPIGFALAALTIGAVESTASGGAGLAVGVLLLAVPLLDMTLRIVSRVRQRVSIYTAGHDSAVDMLNARVPSAPAVSLIAGASQGALSAAAIASEETLLTGILILVSLALGMSAMWFLATRRLTQPTSDAA